MAAKSAEKKTKVDINATNEATEEKTDSKKGKASYEELEAKIAELEGLLKEKEDQHLRMAAEYENFRRRSREEKDATYTDAVADTVGEILPIIDNLESDQGDRTHERLREGWPCRRSSDRWSERADRQI